jgi:Nif-specific regulatory protein
VDPRRAYLETEALCEIARVLSLSTYLSKGCTSSLNILAQCLGMENGTLSLFDPVTGEVFIEAAPAPRCARCWPW